MASTEYMKMLKAVLSRFLQLTLVSRFAPDENPRNICHRIGISTSCALRVASQVRITESRLFVSHPAITGGNDLMVAPAGPNRLPSVIIGPHACWLRNCRKSALLGLQWVLNSELHEFREFLGRRKADMCS